MNEYASNQTPNRSTTHHLLAMAENGVAQAQYELGVYYTSSKEAPRDYPTGIAWLEKALSNKHPQAKDMLALTTYLYADECIAEYNRSKNHELTIKAIRLVMQAARYGLPEAQFNIGLAYKNGSGLPKNEKESEKWLIKASEQGHKGAKKQLKELRKTKMSFRYF